MANQTVTNFVRNLSERFVNFTGSLYARVVAVIPFDSAENELFTVSNPGRISRVPADTVYSGQKTVSAAGTAEALAGSQALVHGVSVKALAGNGGDVYVGDNGVDSSTGFVLAAGEEIFIEVDDLAVIYIDTAVNGEGASYIGS